MEFYNRSLSPEENWAMAKGEALFHKKVAVNMRTQADALRALLISLNIPEEEIDNAQYAHIRISNIADAFTESGDPSTNTNNTGYIL